MKGTIRKHIADKGFGFIVGDDKIERFFHRSAAPEFDLLSEGDPVEFDHEESPKRDKGPRAVNVRLAR